MLRNNISHKELLDCICKYEKEVRNADFISETDVACIYRFKALRREKLVIALLDCFANKQSEIVERAMNMILEDESLSDNIDFYTTNVITDKRAEELETPLRQQGISISFFDSEKMDATSQFEKLVDEEYKEAENEIDPAFFDYLAMSNDASDIKNEFFYSIVLMEVYRHQPVTENEFFEICHNKYGRGKADVRLALKELRKKEKITPLRTGGHFSLTDKEQRKLEIAIKDSKSEEVEFKNRLKQIISIYGFTDETFFWEKLKAEYLAKYTVFSMRNDEGDSIEGRNAKEDIWGDLLRDLYEEKRAKLLEELKKLCKESEYMDQYGLIHSFLNLFRSDKYEGYIKQKKSCVYLDTPVIVDYICAKSKFQGEYSIDWDNTEFTGATDLFGYCEESKDKTVFYIPHDYLQEALGELRKALQFNWFTQFENLPIPPETANVFYNYYLEVKKAKEFYDGDIRDFSFEEFAKQMGFDVNNPEASTFFNKNIGNLRFLLNRLGCETLDKVEVNYSVFDEVKMDYVWYLHNMDKDKSDLAINADVRQALHITEEAKEDDGAGCEFYLVSWDNTLYHIRDKVKEQMEIAGRSYAIYKPRDLAEKLAFRSFKISKESVSNEVFAYANSSFNVKDKIRSLYDNVLNPYFASFGKSNTDLILEVLKLQKASMEGGVDSSPRGDKTAFENIFLSIVSELPKQNISTQNLRDYLNDDANNSDITPLFRNAFEDYNKGKRVNIAKKVCEMVKAYVGKDDKEITL